MKSDKLLTVRVPGSQLRKLMRARGVKRQSDLINRLESTKDLSKEDEAALHEAIKDWKGARATLELLAEKYPNSEAGKKAKLRLKKK